MCARTIPQMLSICFLFDTYIRTYTMFRNVKQLGNSYGLVPNQHQSQLLIAMAKLKDNHEAHVFVEENGSKLYRV
jgi:hypothetical protein